MHRDPKKRLGRDGPQSIKQHPFFEGIDWSKMLDKQYIPPEPYLRKRFDSFLKLPLSKKTNSDVAAHFKKDSVRAFSSEKHISGWSFILPQANEED